MAQRSRVWRGVKADGSSGGRRFVWPLGVLTAAALLGGLFTSRAPAVDEPPGPAPADTAEPPSQPPPAPAESSQATLPPGLGPVDWAMLAEEASLALQQSREALVRQEPRLSAQHLRRAAAHLRLQATQAEGTAQEGLLRAAQALEGLSDRVRAGTHRRLEEAQRVFAEGHWSLARHRLGRVDRLWHDRSSRAAGVELSVLARDLQNAAQWSQAHGHATVREAVDEAFRLAERMHQQVGVTEGQMVELLNQLASAVDLVGDALGLTGQQGAPRGPRRL